MRLLVLVSLVPLCASPTVGAQPAMTETPPNRQEMLRELPASTPIKQQSDLDTVQLASARRARSESVQERTNGLWQSWLVSICEGCGPKMKPYPETIKNDMERNVPPSTFGETSFDVARVASYRRLPPPEYSRRIYTDLSTENVDQIRRSPNR